MSITIIGAGTWGTALAALLANQGIDTTLSSIIKQEIANLRQTKKHPNLPGMQIPDALKLSEDASAACENKDYILIAVPSPYVRTTLKAVKQNINENQIIISVTKGIEEDTLDTMSAIIESELPNNPVVALSGPTHAEEVALNLPTAIVAACSDLAIAHKVADLFQGSCIRAYVNTDVLGVEIGGALKNIMALAAGISTGLGYGDNAKAAIITRGIAEIKRLGLAIGCNQHTFSGLTGVGDLIVTATSMHSRNNKCGLLIGQGFSVGEAKQKVGMVVEGINALNAAVKLAEKYNVQTPIIAGIDQIVNHGVAPKTIVDQLMNQPAQDELD